MFCLDYCGMYRFFWEFAGYHGVTDFAGFDGFNGFILLLVHSLFWVVLDVLNIFIVIRGLMYVLLVWCVLNKSLCSARVTEGFAGFPGFDGFQRPRC